MRRLFALFLLVSSLSLWADPEAGNPDAAFVTKARAQYPIQACVVSGEHLDPGQIVDYVYKEPGKPDRLVRFCCHKCLTRFKADPARYLQKLDAAAAKTGK
jgi:hypothetical protein